MLKIISGILAYNTDTKLNYANAVINRRALFCYRYLKIMSNQAILVWRIAERALEAA